jgi:hypothetical protein
MRKENIGNWERNVQEYNPEIVLAECGLWPWFFYVFISIFIYFLQKYYHKEVYMNIIEYLCQQVK